MHVLLSPKSEFCCECSLFFRLTKNLIIYFTLHFDVTTLVDSTNTYIETKWTLNVWCDWIALLKMALGCWSSWSFSYLLQLNKTEFQIWWELTQTGWGHVNCLILNPPNILCSTVTTRRVSHFFDCRTSSLLSVFSLSVRWNLHQCPEDFPIMCCSQVLLKIWWSIFYTHSSPKLHKILFL